MKVSVNDILGSLFNPEETVCFRVFDDKKEVPFRARKWNVNAENMQRSKGN